MWQPSSHRQRAIAAARRREQERFRRRTKIHVKRAKAEVKVLGGKKNEPQLIAQARIVLNDITPAGVGLFANQPLAVGQDVALALEEPRVFYVKGRIVSCQEYDAESHIISENSYSYRLAIQFVFENEQEEEQVKKYCEDLLADLVRRPGQSQAA